MFIPNTTAMVRRFSGQRDVFGNRIYNPPTRLPCSIVRLPPKTQPTSVRADSSGSRGAAEILATQAKFLFPMNVPISDLDEIDVYGYQLIVTSIEPRIAVTGRLDHYEVLAQTADPS